MLKQTISLIGLMGSGKSSLGKRLAKSYNIPFVDADKEIERQANKTIPQIFEQHGEEAFRKLEQEIITKLTSQPPHILATGGGAFMNDNIRALLLAKTLTVWLNVPIDILVSRLNDAGIAKRPLLKDKDPAEVLQNLANERNPVYKQAHNHFNGSSKPFDKQTEELKKLIDENQR